MSSLFGLDQSNRLVFVNEVPRGLACNCRCVVCNEPLIARQGALREHHFAHASGREPCDVSHESLLHQYAKRVIVEAGGLVVPLTPATASALAVESEGPSVELRLATVEVEKSVQDVRPDLLACTEQGVVLAIEVAYSSFCDLFKGARFEALNLPALEIDLRSFNPEAFDADAVRTAVVDSLDGKAWIWPEARDPAAAVSVPSEPPSKPRLPEEIVTISGRWVSIKIFRSGDAAIRVISFDPDVVSLVKTVAKANHGRYAPKFKSWIVPRWRADAVRKELRALAGEVSITMSAG